MSFVRITDHDRMPLDLTPRHIAGRPVPTKPTPAPAAEPAAVEEAPAAAPAEAKPARRPLPAFLTREEPSALADVRAEQNRRRRERGW